LTGELAQTTARTLMNCEICGNDDPVVHLCEIRNGVKTNRHLCVSCAAKESGMTQDPTKVNITELLTKFVVRHAESKRDDGAAESGI
jgi:protein-arginine kinase activator protein McsA